MKALYRAVKALQSDFNNWVAPIALFNALIRPSYLSVGLMALTFCYTYFMRTPVDNDLVNKLSVSQKELGDKLNKMITSLTLGKR